MFAAASQRCCLPDTEESAVWQPCRGLSNQIFVCDQIRPKTPGGETTQTPPSLSWPHTALDDVALFPTSTIFGVYEIGFESD